MPELENEDIRVTLDDAGSLVGLYDKRLKRSYLGASQFSGLFRLMVPSPQWDGRHFDSRTSKGIRVRAVSATEAEVTCGELTSGTDRCAAAVTARLRLDGDCLIASLEIENQGDGLINEALFPFIGGFATDTGDLTLFIPTQHARRMIRPFQDLGDGNHKGWTRENNRHFIRYPTHLATAWVDYSSFRGGVGIEARSPQFEVTDFCFERAIRKSPRAAEENAQGLYAVLQFHPNLARGGRWRSPDVVVRLHRGDWHVTADAHREWLETVVQPTVTPEAFRNGLGWHFYFMKVQDGTFFRTYDDLPAMAKASQAAGIDYIMVFGWQQKGHDNYYSFGYYPNEDWGGVARLKEKIREVRAQGCHVIPFFNGTLLDITTPEYKEYGHRWPVIGRLGSPYWGGDFSRGNFDFCFQNANNNTTERNMTLLDLCVTGREAREWEKDTIRRISQEYGFGNIQLDQIAHKCYVCYDPAHGHSAPQYASTRELTALLAEVRSALREHDPDGVMVGEGFTDMTAQYCDGFWSWSQLRFPEIIRYSVPWMAYSHETDANEYAEVNTCFINRILLDLKIEGGDGTLADFPQFTAHLRRLSDLKKRLGPTYIDGLYRDEEGITVEGDTVRAKVYHDRARKTACVVAANLTNRRASATLRLSVPVPGDMRVVSWAGGEERTGARSSFRLQLDPYEVRGFEFSMQR
ncbi:MAG TPA: DUF6259 domain-containing protein [Spirochaetia bacterium]|nr:DUF6259 domain-containing protein [Spirochaetia bacterium]